MKTGKTNTRRRGAPRQDAAEARQQSFESWVPRTALGKRVRAGTAADIGKILDAGEHILEAEITDTLLPDMANDLVLVGQAKGKFGGGQRRVFKQTQKKTAEGNKPKFATLIVVGNKDGIVGIGYGKAKETVPAREKAMRNAKMNIFKIRRGCGSWQCGCGEPHSIPFAVEGKSGSIRLKFMPAPRGTGLRTQSELVKILSAAGIKDVWSQVVGQTRTTTNLVNACEAALRQLVRTKVRGTHIMPGMVEGPLAAGGKDGGQ